MALHQLSNIEPKINHLNRLCDACINALKFKNGAQATQGTTACCSKSVLSNHNETLLSLFSGSNQCQLHHVYMEQLFNLVSLCYNYEQSKDHLAFNVVVLKLFGAKRPHDTMQVKKDLKNFTAEVWKQHNKDVMMYCFFQRCYDDAVPALCEDAFFLSTRALGPGGVTRGGVPNVWWGPWGCGKDDNLQSFFSQGGGCLCC